MANQITTSTISDKLYDDVFIYKLFSNSYLLESLKKIEKSEVFTAIEEFYVDVLKVCKFLIVVRIQKFLIIFNTLQSKNYLTIGCD